VDKTQHLEENNQLDLLSTLSRCICLTHYNCDSVIGRLVDWLVGWLSEE
jgi:hypothetical protein